MAKLSITPARTAFLFGAAFAFASPAYGQIQIGPAPINAAGNQVCTEASRLQVSDSEDGCTDGAQDVDRISFFSGSLLETYAGSTASFGGAVNFNSNNVQFNSSNVAFGGGNTAFNSTVTFTGPSVTFSTSTTFQNPSTFNGAITTNGILVANGGISTSGLNASIAQIPTLTAFNTTITQSMTLNAGANINMGGNQVHGVAAGTANTDAVNVAQLNAATSGITADVTALETLTATHTTQIAAIETVNTTQSNQITAIQAVNTTQSGQIGELFAGQDFLSGQIDTLFDLRSRDRRDMKQGVAAAMSMAQAPMPSGPGKVSYAVNGALFRGEKAVGGSLMYRLPTEAPMAVSVGVSFAGNKNNGVRVGVAGEF